MKQNAMSKPESTPDLSAADSPHFSLDEASDAAEVAAWQEVSAGRYMPRRVRGSCQGRALG